MVTREQLYVLDYYKRNTYMGSYENLYYRVHKIEESQTGDDGEPTDPVKKLEAICWQGPFIFDKTPDENKIYKTFEYSEEGLVAVVDWLNQQHDALADN